MSNSTKLLLAGVILGAALGATAKTVVVPRSTYTDASYAFSMQTPRFPKAPPKGSTIVASFTAPPEDAFATNVNVIVQTVKMSRKAYQELTAEQLKQLGITPISEKVRKVSGKEAIEWEYENEIQGTALHFLQLAVIDTDRVILATCTAPTDKFAKYEPEFRASLNSLKLTGKK